LVLAVSTSVKTHKPDIAGSTSYWEPPWWHAMADRFDAVRA